MASFTGETMTGRRWYAALAAGVAVVCAASLAAGVPSASAASTTSTSAATSAAKTAARAYGQGPLDAPVHTGSYFSFPNRSASESRQIRSRVLNTIKSTWGYYSVKDADGNLTGEKRRGTITMATWSFNDMAVRDALVDAAKRGVRVQIIAAESINREMDYKPWKSLRQAINVTIKKHPGIWPNAARDNFARQCRGACRGSGGTPHSKYFLFDDVGSTHQHNVVMQTSMNLTLFAYKGQWNSAVVWKDAGIYNHFKTIFAQSAANKSRGSAAYVRTAVSGVVDIFYPGGTQSRDPVLYALNRVHCTGAKSGGVGGRTRIRIVNYAIYDTRGVAIAKKLRSLWNSGCNIRIIYSLSTRGVLGILRSKSGRGPIPMKQSVIKNRSGEIVKYNHSKYMAISGHYGTNTGNWTVLAGSANWSNFAYHCDEQMQQWFTFAKTAAYFRNFDKTWNQPSSKAPKSGRTTGASSTKLEAVPGNTPPFGQGKYKLMLEGG
jgi:hypothetical protein